MAMAHHNHHHYDVGHPIYGLVDYHHRFGGHHHSPLNDPTRFYGGPGSFSQPINGSPLPGLWRVPAMHRSGMPLPLLGGEGSGLRRVGGSVAPEGGGGGGSVAQIRHVYGSGTAVAVAAARVQDHVSLDLHL
ncbi:hypothetical protein QJS10_CPA09g00332 [Acorus calamus]|uniref:Uncharacterized protein n=1 Tax=Acorus calamus TaxID=4465 RepID=A0AAV9E9B6_ACOCL|nr:hypothetical protein QJS10_CPA09g00332 [Acorus calamus]